MATVPHDFAARRNRSGSGAGDTPGPCSHRESTGGGERPRDAVLATESAPNQIVTRSVTGQGPGYGRSRLVFDGRGNSSWTLDFSEPGASFNGLLQIFIGKTLYQSALYYASFQPTASSSTVRHADAILKGRFFEDPGNNGGGDSDIRAYAFALLPNPTGATAVSRIGDIYSVAFPNQPALMRLVVAYGRVTSMRLTAPKDKGGYVVVNETFSHFGLAPEVSAPSPGNVTVLSTTTRTCVPQVTFVCVS